MEFCTERVLGSTQIEEIHSFDEKRPHGFINIATWIEQRNYAKHKEHFKKWLKEWELDTIDGFLNITHALGINDCLWVKPVDSMLTWEQINLYDNEFSDVAARTAFETGLHGLQISSTSPEFTTDGTFPKCWQRNGEKILLYKAGQTGFRNVGLEPHSEYMASHISSKLTESLGVGKSVSYDLTNYKGRVVSVCSLFTNQSIGFVPAYKLVDKNRYYTLNDVLKLCTDMGFEEECRAMILIDSVTFNQDRHLGNFGFLFDNETFEIIGFAPLFDFNVSMLGNALQEDLENFSKYEEEFQIGHKLGGHFLETGIQILTPKMKQNLPKYLDIPIHENYHLSKERLNCLSSIFTSNYHQICGKGKIYGVSNDDSRCFRNSQENFLSNTEIEEYK